MNINELITKYLCQECTPKENNALLNWVISSEDNKQEFITACQNWYTTNRRKEENSFDSEKAFNSFLSKRKETKKPTKTVSIWQRVSATAAIVVLTLGAFFLFNQQNNIEMLAVSNNQNNISDITLPDGSHVYLHKNATVTYPSKFESNDRTIKATGHFFCEVEPNKDAPFTVHSENIDITVLGTAFDVQSSKNNSEIIVSHGKVKVNAGNESVILEKNDRADLNKDGLTKAINNDVNFLSWKTGVLTFNGTNLKQVFSDIERHYNISIIVNDESILGEQITGTYKDYQLEDIMTIISSTFSNLRFENIENTYTVSK